MNTIFSRIYGHSLWTTGHVILHTKQFFLLLYLEPFKPPLLLSSFANPFKPPLLLLSDESCHKF